MQLPKFIYSAIEKHNTSLGNNGAFPNREDVSFDYIAIKKRIGEVEAELQKVLGYIPSVDEAEALLSKLMVSAVKLETPLRPQLEKLCEAIVTMALGVPEGTVILDCQLVDKINPDIQLRILPEHDENEPKYTFDDVDELEIANKIILKRRMVNALTQGAAYTLMRRYFDNDIVEEWCDELAPLYNKIIALNDYLLFTKKEEISDKNPVLGSYVETHIGTNNEKTVITAEGLLFPLLLQELFRGFFELFGSHGLPQDAPKANYIMHHADFLMAEAWDLRMGVPLWEYIDKSIDTKSNDAIYPYLFTSLVQLDTSVFNKTLQNIFAQTKKGKRYINDIVKEIVHDKEYQEFKKEIGNINIEKTVLADNNASQEDSNSIITEGEDDSSGNEVQNAWNAYKAWRDEKSKKYGASLWFDTKLMAKYYPSISIDPKDIETRKELLDNYETLKKKSEAVQKEKAKKERLEKEKANAIEIQKQNEIFELAIENFGLTNNIHEAGYILPNGSLLKFGAYGQRGTDHRNIECIYLDNNITIWDNNYRYNYVVDFMNRGAIRIDVNTGLLDMTNEPTKEQYRVLSNFVRISGGDIDIDFTNHTGNNICSASYESAKPQRIINDIFQFYNNNIQPTGNIQ